MNGSGSAGLGLSISQAAAVTVMVAARRTDAPSVPRRSAAGGVEADDDEVEVPEGGLLGREVAAGLVPALACAAGNCGMRSPGASRRIPVPSGGSGVRENRAGERE